MGEHVNLISRFSVSAGQPQIIRPDNTDIEESFEKSVNLNCMVRGFPVPSITWTTSDGQVQEQELIKLMHLQIFIIY